MIAAIGPKDLIIKQSRLDEYIAIFVFYTFRELPI